MFSVGERVLCVDGDRWGQFSEGHSFQVHCCPNLPRRGRIYTVREIWDKNPKYLRLVEVVNPLNYNHIEPVFECTQFVPLKRTETDISVFTAILQRRTRVRSITPRKKERA